MSPRVVNQPSRSAYGERWSGHLHASLMQCSCSSLDLANLSRSTVFTCLMPAGVLSCSGTGTFSAQVTEFERLTEGFRASLREAGVERTYIPQNERPAYRGSVPVYHCNWTEKSFYTRTADLQKNVRLLVTVATRDHHPFQVQALARLLVLDEDQPSARSRYDKDERQPTPINELIQTRPQFGLSALPAALTGTPADEPKWAAA